MEMQTSYQTTPPQQHVNQNNINNNNNNINNNNENTNGEQTYFAEIKIDDGKWTRDQTQILIDTWKLHKDILLNSASSLSEHFRVWKIIASEVNKLAPPKSLQQCKKKFRNIRYICKTAMNNNKQPGAKKHYPMFYTEFVKILSESQKLLFDDKMKYDGVGDDGIEYQEPISGDGHPGDGLDYHDHGEPTMAKYYSPKMSNYGSPRASPHESPTSCSNDADIVVDVNGTPVVSVIPLASSEIKSEITYVPNGIDSAKPGEEHCHSNNNNNNTNNNNNNNHNHRSTPTDDDNNNNTHNNSDTPPRKHRHDISIMGYPAHKRPRLEPHPSSTPNHHPHPQTLIHHKTVPVHKTCTDYYPTMASIPSESSHVLPSSGSSAFSKTNSIKYDVKDRFGSRITPGGKKLTNGAAGLKYGSRNLASGSPNGIKHKSGSAHAPNANAMEIFQERFLDLQERQMELFNDMLQRHEQFLMRLLQQQREAAEEAQQRDRNFMFKLVEVFLKDKQ